MDSYTRPELTRSALITIDTQNDFTLAGAPAHIPGTLEVIPNMQRLLALYRQRGWPVIHVVRLYLPDGSNAELCRRRMIEQGRTLVVPDSDGAELVTALKPDASLRLDAESLLAGQFQSLGADEYVMYKSRWGAFYQTELENFLHQRGVNTVVICGCNYPNCPRSSIYQASERDFRILLVSDAVSGLTEKDRLEMKNIGVHLRDTSTLEADVGKI
jgi:nicotinamidase-related amidase